MCKNTGAYRVIFPFYTSKPLTQQLNRLKNQSRLCQQQKDLHLATCEKNNLDYVRHGLPWLVLVSFGKRDQNLKHLV